jgi:hypothetical protein
VPRNFDNIELDLLPALEASRRVDFCVGYFTDEDLDVYINYDIKFRTGRDGAEEDDPSR